MTMSSSRKLRRFAKRRNALSVDVSNLVAMQEIRQAAYRRLMAGIVDDVSPSQTLYLNPHDYKSAFPEAK